MKWNIIQIWSLSVDFKSQNMNLFKKSRFKIHTSRTPLFLLLYKQWDFFPLNQTFLLILKKSHLVFSLWILFPLEIRHNRPRSATFSSSSRFPLRLFLWVSLVTNVSRRVLLTGQMFCKLLVSKWWMPPVLLEIWSTPSNVRVVRF